MFQYNQYDVPTIDTSNDSFQNSERNLKFEIPACNLLKIFLKFFRSMIIHAYFPEPTWHIECKLANH